MTEDYAVLHDKAGEFLTFVCHCGHIMQATDQLCWMWSGRYIYAHSARSNTGATSAGLLKWRSNMAKKTKWHKISNAYDAYWFLKEHPKLQRMFRIEVSAKDADKLERKHFLISRDQGGKCWRYYRHGTVAAIEENLDIFYTKTNKPGGHGRVDDDRSKNKYIECWLEFGPVYYAYAYSGTDKPQGEWDDVTIEQHSHDWRTDTGGSTFDQGLVNLARKVRKVYGDYAPRDGRDGKCGRPCGDCIDMKKRMKKPPGKRRTIGTKSS